MKLELENVLKDFNRDKNHNKFLQDEVARLEMSLKHSKVSSVDKLCSFNILLKLDLKLWQ